MEKVLHFFSFIKFFAKRLYVVFIVLAADPWDVAATWFKVRYEPPFWLFWLLLLLSVGFALIMALRDIVKSEQIHAEPVIWINIQRTKLVFARGNNTVLIDVSLELHTTNPVRIDRIKLKGIGKDIYEYSNMRKLGAQGINNNLIGSAFFPKPLKARGIRNARIWIKIRDGKQQISSEFIVDLNQQPERNM
jgi:hypothetical protein